MHMLKLNSQPVCRIIKIAHITILQSVIVYTSLRTCFHLNPSESHNSTLYICIKCIQK